MNKKIAAMFVMGMLFVVTLFAHGGHAHKVLGTVQSLQANNLAVTTTEKKVVTVRLTAKTKISRGSDVVDRAQLKAGTRVSIELADDGKTATVIKLGAKTK